MMKQEVRREGGRTAVLDVGHDLDEARGAGGVQLAGLQDRRPNLAHLRAGDANRPLHNPNVHLSSSPAGLPWQKGAEAAAGDEEPGPEQEEGQEGARVLTKPSAILA